MDRRFATSKMHRPRVTQHIASAKWNNAARDSRSDWAAQLARVVLLAIVVLLPANVVAQQNAASEPRADDFDSVELTQLPMLAPICGLERELDAQEEAFAAAQICGGNIVSDLSVAWEFRQLRGCAEVEPLLQEAGEPASLCDHPLFIRRHLQFNERAAVLATDVVTLRSYLIDHDALLRESDEIESQYVDDAWPLLQTLQSGRSRTLMRLEPSIREASPHTVYLTVDMCPSSQPIAGYLFRQINALATEVDGDFSVSIAISGNWLVEHEEAFVWLQALAKHAKWRPRWINHSMRHGRDRHNRQSLFLTHPRIRIDREILSLEKLLLEFGEVPSIYFRFPGLRADRRRLQQISEYGLIALGADAWVGNDETIYDGSVVLVHGNGNESEGMFALQRFFRETGGELLQAHLRFGDVYELGQNPAWSDRHPASPKRDQFDDRVDDLVDDQVDDPADLQGDDQPNDDEWISADEAPASADFGSQSCLLPGADCFAPSAQEQADRDIATLLENTIAPSKP